ncbi:MAG: hypothetical protein KJZ78_20655 [Bryobacteraceae bacterium]|nr:hypothetical protein [Bryobacteraceae bacterium]
MQYRNPDSKKRVRTLLIVSLAETPFLLGGALLLAFGGKEMLIPAVALITLTAVTGSVFIVRSLMMRNCPECERPLEATLEGPYCVGCDVCYTNDPKKLSRPG